MCVYLFDLYNTRHLRVPHKFMNIFLLRYKSAHHHQRQQQKYPLNQLFEFSFLVKHKRTYNQHACGTQIQPLIFNISPRHVNNVKYYEFIVSCCFSSSSSFFSLVGWCDQPGCPVSFPSNIHMPGYAQVNYHYLPAGNAHTYATFDYQIE